MGKVHGRRDRTARLLKLQLLLWQNPNGLEVEEIALKCSINKRTVYRDLEALETELGVPIWEQGKKRGIDKAYFLPPIPFTVDDAMNIFMASRLMQNYYQIYNPSVASTFMKLNAIVPNPLKMHIQETIESLNKQPHDERKIRNFNLIRQAWLTHRRVKIWYQTFLEEKPQLRTIEPYYIEPSTLRRTPIVIAYCHLKQSIYVYNMDAIIGDAILEDSTFEIPPNYNASDYINSPWDNYFDDRIETVKLHFSKQTSRILMSTKWHPSQKEELLDDGSLILTFNVSTFFDFRSWILGWGDDVEVLEPEALRSWIVGVNKSIGYIYTSGLLPPKPMQSSRIRVNQQMTEITNNQWKQIKKILPSKAPTGRPRENDRKILNGINWLLKTGCRWIDIPRSFGNYATCHHRLQIWKKQGLWPEICEILNQVQ
jgi:predicted DNA-binding transcriptional regulator YafY